MKLQAQYNRITIISTLVILLIAAVSYYFLLRYVLISQLDEALKVEEAEIVDHIKEQNNLPPPTVYKDQRISFKIDTNNSSRIFRSLELFDSASNQSELSRQLLFPVELQGKHYIVSVIKSEESTEDLVWIILFSTIALIVLLTAILFFSNRFLLKKLWQPFRDTLSSIKEFNLSVPGEISIQPTKITEFKELNESIRMMTQKVMTDYQALKNFTDHASHEMQTPLAIINSKLDILIQEPELSGKSMEQIQGIYNAVEKLSRLCQSLLLMARIENNQYKDLQVIAINKIIEEKKTEMQEWISGVNMVVVMRLEPLPVTMNKDLAETLVSNLFRNAIRHNQTGGKIQIETKNKKFLISNPGKRPLDKNGIFTRFYKSDHSDGSGLGLAIVQQICDHYQFNLQYDFVDWQHCFTIEFS